MRAILAAVACAAFAAVMTQSAQGEGVDDYARQSLAALKSGDADKALALAEKAVAVDPKNAEGYYVRAAARAGLHKSADAVADYDKTLELDPQKVDAYDYRGSEHFKLGQFKESVADFDRFLEAKPVEKPGHWRRGISLYYAGRYDDGRKQFAAYEKVTTNDVENAVWHFLCAARADGVEKARPTMLKIGKDNRIPMMKVYDLYHGDAKPEDVMAAAEAGDATPDERKQRLMFAHLYLGLYYDATGDKKQALDHMTLAAHKYYIDTYMGEVARVHEEVLLKNKEKPK